MLSFIKMHGEGGGFINEYISIMTDPAHLAAELTILLIDMLILSPLLFFIWNKVKDKVHRNISEAIDVEHAKIDEEHGVEHNKV